MTQRWQEIWSKRERAGKGDLQELINLDGFDSGAGKIELEDWRAYTEIIGKKLGLRDGHSVFEVGCGSGAFLYSLKEKNRLKVGGLDYAKGLIDSAKSVLPEGDFDLMKAQELTPLPQYDFVIANAVFHYLSLEDASIVLDGMMKKAKIAVAVLDVPDLKGQEEYDRVRRGSLGKEEYEQRYSGLDHTLFGREWFEIEAKKSGRKIEIFESCVPNCAQSHCRFGSIIWT